MPCDIPGRLSHAGVPAGPKHQEQRRALPGGDAVKLSSLKCLCRSRLLPHPAATSRCQVTSCCCSRSPPKPRCPTLPSGHLAEQIPAFDDFAPGVRAAHIKAEPHLIFWLCSCLLPALGVLAAGCSQRLPSTVCYSGFEVPVLGEGGAPGQISGVRVRGAGTAGALSTRRMLVIAVRSALNNGNNKNKAAWREGESKLNPNEVAQKYQHDHFMEIV